MSARDELAAAVAEHGPFPMPVGPEPETDDRAKTPWGRAEDGRPFLPMGAHWTDIPELVDQRLADVQVRIDQSQPGGWFVSPTAAAPGTVCTRYDGYTRTVGRFTNTLPADLEVVLHAHSDLIWCLDLIAKLRARVAELEAAQNGQHRAGFQQAIDVMRQERLPMSVGLLEAQLELDALDATPPCRMIPVRVWTRPAA